MRGGANHLNASIGKLINAGQFSPSVCSVHFSRVFQMSSLEWWLAAVTNRAANLTRQLRELCKLRDRVRQAELSTRKCGNPRRRSGMKPRSRIRRAPAYFVRRSQRCSLLAFRIAGQGPHRPMAEADQRRRTSLCWPSWSRAGAFGRGSGRLRSRASDQRAQGGQGLTPLRYRYTGRFWTCDFSLARCARHINGT
jgi:hypothetical protein